MNKNNPPRLMTDHKVSLGKIWGLSFFHHVPPPTRSRKKVALKSWKPFFHILKIEGDMANWSLEKSQSKNRWPPSINISKLKLSFPVSNLTYVAYWFSFMSRSGAIKKISIDVFLALLRTLKGIGDVIRSDVINYLNKKMFNRPTLKNLKP